MKFYSVLIYLVISGLIGGLVANGRYERCGAPVVIDAEMVLASISWPVILGMALVVDNDDMWTSSCANTQKQDGE